MVLVRALCGETVVNAEFELHRPDCSTIVAQLNAAPVITEDGRQLGAVSVFRDITERAELDRVKDSFLSAAAHDLKTPLATIKAVAQMSERRLQRPEPDLARLEDALRRIDTTATRAARMVNELLDLSRLQMGQPLDLQFTELDLGRLVRQTVAELPDGQRSRIVLPEVTGEARVVGDELRLERVLANLISNAVKYSPAGAPIELGLRVESDEMGGWVVVTVRDRGIGIPAEDQDKIFGRFYRARNVEGRIPGTGIGLFSARQVVESHRGQIEIESQEGAGTTVTVRLPLAGRSGGEGG
jgi:signal transduction histidine kinase